MDKIFYVVPFEIPHKISYPYIERCAFYLDVISCSDNGLSPGHCQAIILTNSGVLLIGPLGTNLIEILIEIHTFSFKEIHFKMSSGMWREFCVGLDVLTLIT